MHILSVEIEHWKALEIIYNIVKRLIHYLKLISIDKFLDSMEKWKKTPNNLATESSFSKDFAYRKSLSQNNLSKKEL